MNMSAAHQMRCVKRAALDLRTPQLYPRLGLRLTSQAAAIRRFDPPNPNDPVPHPRLNPPNTCRPPPLRTPTRGPSQPYPMYLFALGKAYLAFYKTAIKGVWVNGRTTRHAFWLAKRAEKGKPEDPNAKPLAVPHKSRAEFQLMWRQLHDGPRLPLVGVLVAVFFEFTPIVMTVFRKQLTPLLPYPCRLPEQVHVGRLNRLRKQQKAELRLRMKGKTATELNEVEYIRFSAEFHGLRIPIFPWAVHPDWYLFRNVRKYYDYLRWDDLFIERDGGVAQLLDEEVHIAALDRGLWDAESSVRELRRRLEKNVQKTVEQEKIHAKVLQKRHEFEQLKQAAAEKQALEYALKIKQKTASTPK